MPDTKDLIRLAAVTGVKSISSLWEPKTGLSSKDTKLEEIKFHHENSYLTLISMRVMRIVSILTSLTS